MKHCSQSPRISAVLLIAGCTLVACAQITPAPSSASPAASAIPSASASPPASPAAPDPFADLTGLPVDTGSSHLAVAKGSTTATYGYYLYKPAGDAAGTARYPLLVYLHGDGSSEASSGSGLAGILNQGPAWVLANNTWSPRYPMIVVSPQNHDDTGWVVSELDAFISYLVNTYPVNPSRIYLAGASHGAMGVYDYLTAKGSASRIAAAVPVAGNSATGSAGKVSCPVWAFHGGKDTTVSPAGDKAMIAAIKAGHPALDTKITIFSNLGHEANIIYYSFSRDYWLHETATDGRKDVDPAFAPYDKDIYSWMLQFKHG